MPRYDFKCETCKVVHEIVRAFEEVDTPSCPGCGLELVRIWQATPAHFKGGGWGAE